MDRREKTTQGAQSVRRALGILRQLSDHQLDGLRGSDVVALSGLERSTANRLLQCLVEQGFAEQDRKSRRYRLGLQSLRVGLATMRRFPFVDRLRPVMKQLAYATEDTVYLLVRDGDDSLCLHREEGAFPIKMLTLDVGTRRPLGVGVGGLALLSAMMDGEIETIMARRSNVLRDHQLERGAILRSVRAARRMGYVESLYRPSDGVCGVGTAVGCVPGETSEAAISIGAMTMRMNPVRRRQIGQMLRGSMAEYAAGAHAGR
jgi:DNA-binding IclR family transcriptional regulator